MQLKLRVGLTSGVVLCCFVLVTSARAGVFVEELFDYTEGASVYGQNGGTGFTSDPWTDDTDGTIDIESGRPHVVPASGSTISFRDLATPLTDGDNVWIAYTADLDNQDSTRFFGVSLYNGGTEKALIGQSTEQEWKYHQSSPGVSYLTGVSAADDGSGGNPGPVRLVVNLKLLSGQEEVQMWVVDEGGAIDQGSPNVSATIDDLGSITTLRIGAGFTSGSNPTAPGVIDDFQIGTEAADVVDLIPRPTVEIDRTTGAVSLNSSPEGATTFVGYSITSANGALNPSNGVWNPISGTRDLAGNKTVDPDDNWTKLSDPDARTDLSEFEFGPEYNGVTLGASTTVGLGNAWIQGPLEFEDAEAEIVLDDGTLVPIVVNYTGGSGPFEFGDLDFDGNFDEDDFFNEFAPSYLTDTTDLSAAERYQAGDFNDDGVTDRFDFFLFNDAYLAANPGAAGFSLASIPEPSSAILILIVSLSLLFPSTSRRFI